MFWLLTNASFQAVRCSRGKLMWLCHVHGENLCGISCGQYVSFTLWLYLSFICNHYLGKVIYGLLLVVFYSLIIIGRCRNCQEVAFSLEVVQNFFLKDKLSRIDCKHLTFMQCNHLHIHQWEIRSDGKY